MSNVGGPDGASAANVPEKKLEEMDMKTRQEGQRELRIEESNWNAPAAARLFAQRFATTPQMAIINPEGALVFNGALDNSPMGKKKGDPVSHVSNSLQALQAGQPVPDSRPKPYGCSVKYAK